MKTVLHTIDTTGPGGAETVCVELAAGLDPARYRSEIAVLGPGWLYDALRSRHLDPTIVRTARVPVDVPFLFRLITLARRHSAGLIQTHLLGTGLYGTLAARLLRLPAVATFHGLVDVAPNDRRAGLKLRAIAANASRVVVPSDALGRHLEARFPVVAGRLVVVPNGIDPDAFRPAPRRDLRAELGAPDETILVGSVGNVRPAKAYDVLLRVAARLVDRRPQIRFAIAGDPGQPLFDELRALHSRLGLRDRVVFVGFREDVATFLNGVDIYLSTSTSEGFSLTCLQAMACGVPVVATRSGGPEEILTDGEDGILVPVNDEEAIAAAVENLAMDAGSRRRLGLAGREKVRARFTVRRMVAAYEAIYAELTTEGR